MQVRRTPPHRPPPAGRVATDAEAEHDALDAAAAAPPKTRARARAAAATRPAPVAAQPAAPRARRTRASPARSPSSAASEAARAEAPGEVQLALSIVDMGEALVAAAPRAQASRTHAQGQRARNARLAAQAFVDDATLSGHPVADALQAG